MARSLGTTFIVGIFLLAGLTSAAQAQRTIPINIESTPPGATVYVDATTTPPIGATPLRNARVATGSHTLIFQLPNYEEARLPVNVRRRRETFRVVLNPLGTIVVTGGNDAANGAAVRIDGQAVGNVPFRQTVQPGRHQIQVGREGYVTFTQWAEVAGGQVFSLPVMLERQAPETGSILVAADISGVPIYVDGDPRGTTPSVIENLTAGEHQFELRADGREPFRQTVRIMAGERATLNATLRPGPAQVGRIRVLANVPGAIVSLDGEVLGEAPVSKDDVAPGEHILEANAEGFTPVQQPVTIESGQQRVVSLRLERNAEGAGDIIVRANVGGAVITVDGQERGNPPVVVDSPPAGTHAVVVTADGYQDFRTTCETAPGRNCEIEAQLRPRGTPVRVVANIRDAQLFVDGEPMGPVPFEGNLPIGQHRVEVRADGYHTHVEQVNLIASAETREFNVSMTSEAELTEEERLRAAEIRERDRMGASSHAAAVLPTDFALLDLSIGWPYIAEARLGVGILDWLEGGFAIRTFGRLTEFEGRVKAGVRPLRQLSVAAEARFGGGLGPDGSHSEAEQTEADCLEGDTGTCMTGAADGMRHPLEPHSTNTFFLTLEAKGTLHFSDQGGFTLWVAGDFITDSYHYLGSNSGCVLYSQFGSDFVDATSPSSMACMDDSMRPRDDYPTQLPGGRQDTARFRLGGALDLVLDRNWNIFAILEGILAGDKRRILGDLFGFGNTDTQLYFRLGFTYKF